ncbi:hypothetical protein AB0N93_36300 [Streptomyces sp. NPDC091267]|uniref:hypothetical protein n=1 Tax=Streptomyces sp. NPDC091267 TaxID=3155195 RepID=UPI00343CAE47
MESDGSRYINFAGVGQGEWKANGDTLEALDYAGDGYGIEAHLSTGRVASTRGKPAEAIVDVTGNLPEGKYYKLWVCVVKGSYEYCSGKVDVHA